MAELDPSIILRGGEINDPARMLSLRELAMKIKGQEQQIQSQNMLKQLFASPKTYDAQTGRLAPDALRQVMATDPKMGMDLMQDQAQLADVKLKRQGAIQDMVAPVRDSALQAYETAVKNGASPEAAQAAGQKALEEGITPLKNGGSLSDEEQAQLATKFDPAQFRARALTYAQQKQLEEKEKSDERADRREDRMSHHEEVMEGLAGQRLGQADSKGWELFNKPDGTTVRVNKNTGEVKPLEDAAGITKIPGKADDSAKFTPEMGELGAALAERGVSVPSGFRSKSQQASLYQGLLDRNKDKTPDEIADLVKKGQIELGAQKKETQTAAGTAGRVEVAQNEINEFIPLVREASEKVPRGDFLPLTKLVQMTDTQISDPNLKALKIRVNSLLNAYDQLAARGGTDAEKRKEARNLLLSSDSPEVLESALKSFELEAEAAHRAAVKATKVPELENTTKAPASDDGWSVKKVQ